MKVDKAEVLLHPIRMKIVRTLMGHNKEGLTPLDMVKIIQDVPQATLYRHIQKLADANIIRVLKEEKVRAVTEKYYVVNTEKTSMNPQEWEAYSIEEKLDYFFYFQISLFNQYQTYLNNIKKEDKKDSSTLSVVDLQLDDQTFQDFQADLNDLMKKYYQKSTEKSVSRTIGITIFP
ncbi:helix-turn-helix domain-containing protein [Pseudogracilibacillus sp. ICA-222130]|uniref:helix-turn-helix domain-containing protein n=1 Tax=Pseudogracilibacillus sp. ICA-222130 TaxID=3134655 RepID=UPI0030C2FAE2